MYVCMYVPLSVPPIFRCLKLSDHHKIWHTYSLKHSLWMFFSVFRISSPFPPQGGVHVPPRGAFLTNCPISLKFGTNGPCICRNGLALLKFSFSPPFPQPPPAPPGGSMPPSP